MSSNKNQFKNRCHIAIWILMGHHHMGNVGGNVPQLLIDSGEKELRMANS